MKFLHLLLFIFMTGCISVTDTDISHQVGDIRMQKRSDGSMSVSLKTPTLERKEQGSIDPEESFAKNRNGRIIKLIIEENEYAKTYPEPSYFTSHFIWLSSPSGEKMKWDEEQYFISIVLSSARGREIFEASFKLRDSKTSIAIPRN